MARKRRGPWLRKSDSCFYTTIGRQSIKLGSADTPWNDIERAYHAAHAKGTKPVILTLAWLCDEYLDFVKQHRATTTFDWYSEYLKNFCAFVGSRLRVDGLTHAILNRWISKSYGKSSPSSRHAAARCVVRVMNWAIAERVIVQSPLLGYIKPAAGTREVAITPTQYSECLKHAKGRFRDALTFLWQTGCRPQELRVIEARWIDGRKIVLPAVRSKGKKRRRVIYLDDSSAAIVHRLTKENPAGPVFRNSTGQPWTKDSLNCAFRRLRRKTNIDGLCAYALRHGFATEALKRGVDTTTVGVLMGHANPNMVAKVYQHLAQDDDYMLRVMVNLGAGNSGLPGIQQVAAG